MIRTRSVSYESIPLISLNQLIKIINLSKTKIKEVRKPTLIIYSPDDPVIRKDSVDFIMENLPTKKKRKFKIDNSYHMVLLDKYRSKVHKEVLKFIKHKK